MALLARRSGRPSAHFTACGCVYIILDRGDYMSSWLVFCNHIGHMRRLHNWVLCLRCLCHVWRTAWGCLVTISDWV